jgi:molecular chaperone DnaK (HSP70)
MLDSEDPETLGRASGALWNLACAGPDVCDDLAECGAVDKLFDMLEADDPELLGNCTMCISIMSSAESVADSIRENGMIGKFVQLLDHEDDTVAQNAVAAIWNLGHSSANREILLQENAIEGIIKLLGSDSEEMIEKTLGALLTLAASEQISADFREKGGLEALMVHLEPETSSTDKNLLYTIISFAVLAYEEKNKDAIRECGALALLLDLLKTDNDSHLEKVTAAILNLTLNQGNRVAIRQLDGIAPLIELLFHPNANVQQNAAGALWNLSNDDKNKTVIRQLGGLKPLLTLIGGGKVAPKSKKDRAIDRDLAKEISDELDREEEVVDEDDHLKDPEYKKPTDKDGNIRTTSAGNGEHGGDGLRSSAVLVGAGKLDIKDRMRNKAREKKFEEEKAAKREKERLEQEEREREARRIEREKRDAERREREEKERKEREEREKELQRERERLKKLEEEERKKREKEEEERKRKEAEEMKKLLDAQTNWDEIYPADNPFVPSTSREDAIAKLQQSLADYADMLDPFSDKFNAEIYNNMTPEEREAVMAAIKEFEDWLKNNPNATQEEIDAKRRELDAKIRPILNRAMERNKLEQYAHDVKKRIEDEDFDLLDDDLAEIQQKIKRTLEEMHDNPELTPEKLQEMLQNLKKVVEPIIEKAIVVDELEEAAKGLRRRVREVNDPLSKLSDEEKKLLENEAKKALEFLENNPHATADEVREKLNKFNENTDPITGRTAAHEKLNNYATNLKERAANDVKLAQNLRPDEKKTIEEAVQETLDWIKKNPNATKEQLEDKYSSLTKITEPIMKRAEAKSKLNDFAYGIRERLADRGPNSLASNLTDKERQLVDDAISDALDKVRRNPDMSEKELKQTLKRLHERVDPLVGAAQSRGDLNDYTSTLRSKVLQDKKLAPLLTDEEKKILEQALEETVAWSAPKRGLKNDASEELVAQKRSDLESKVRPILERTNARLDLESRANAMRDRLAKDKKLADRLTPQEKKLIEDAINEALTFTKKSNKDQTQKAIDAARRKFDQITKPVLSDAEARQQLADYMEKIMDKMLNDVNDPLNTMLTKDEKKQIEDAIKELQDWLKKNPNATQDEVNKKMQELENKINHIIARAMERNALDAYAHKMKNRINDEDDDLFDFLTEEEKKIIDQEADKAMEAMAKNPGASVAEVKAIRKEMDKKTVPLVKMAESKKQLDDLTKSLREKLDDAKLDVGEKQLLQDLINQSEQFVAKLPSMNARSTPQDINKQNQQIRDKIAELQNKSKPVIEHAQALKDLDNLAHNLRKKVKEDPEFFEKLTNKEKQTIEDAVAESLRWMDNNGSKSKTDEIKNKIQDLERTVNPLIANAEARHTLEQAAVSIQDQAGKMEREASVSKADANALRQAAQNAVDFVKNNPNATKDEIQKKQKEFDEKTKPILEKIKEASDLNALANNIRDRMHQDRAGGSLASNMTPQERQQLEKSLEETKKWLEQNTGKDSSGKATVEDVRKQKKELKSKIDNIIKAAQDRGDLHNQADTVRERIANDSRLTDSEKKQIEAALQPTIDFLAKNPNASSADIAKEKKQLADRLKPLYERSDKLKQLTSEANRARDRLNTDPSLAASAPTVTDKERKDLQDAIADANEWARTKGVTATPKEIEQKKKEFMDKITPLLSRIDARDGLENYSKNIQNKLDDSNDPIMNSLSATDKKSINDNAQAALDWLEQNPKATKQQVDDYLEQLKNKIKPVLERAEKRAALSDYAGDLRGKLGGALGAGNDDFGGDFDDLSYEDRKAIDDQTRAIQDWLNSKPTATAKEIGDKHKDIAKNLDPIVKKAELRNELNDVAQSIADKLDDSLSSHIPNREKQMLQDLVDENMDFLNRTKKQPVSRTELEDRLKQLQGASDAIVKRAQLTKDMQDYINDTKKKQDDPELGKHLSVDDKRKVDAALQDAQDWLKLNQNSPTLTPEQVQSKLDSLKESVKPLIEKAEEKKDFLAYAQALQKRLAEDKALLANLTNDEKKKITDKLNEELKWLNSTPNATVEEIKEHRKKLESVVQPIVDRVDAKIALADFIKSSKDQLNDKDLAANLTAEERKTIENTIKDAESWMDKNAAKATKRDFDQKRKEIENKINPLVDKAKEKRNLINYATNIRDRIKNDAQLASILTNDEKKLIDDTANEVIEWVKKHGDKATLAELRKKKDGLEKTINSILESKDERNNLLEYARKVLDILNNNEEVRKGMTKDELRDVDDYAQAVLDWLAEHPNATAHEIRMMKKQLEDNLAKVKNFKFVVPYKQFVGFRFNEQTRWGISENRSKEFVYGSYLQQQERREREAALKRGDKPKEEVKPQQPAEKKFKVASKSKYSQLGLSKQDEEDLKLFTTMKGSKGGLIQATLNSLQDTTGRVKAEFGSVVGETGGRMPVYPYAQLKNGNKSFPEGVDPQKREQYLSDTEFQQIFKMSKADFSRLANFKQHTLKKNAELFQFAYEQ